MISGIAIAVAVVLLVMGPRIYRRWDVARRAGRAPNEQDQVRHLTAQFDGRDLVVADPRDFTITVGHMNVLANRVGYYYIGESGTMYGSTEVAFQRLPSPPPLPLPRKAPTWSPWQPA